MQLLLHKSNWGTSHVGNCIPDNSHKHWKVLITVSHSSLSLWPSPLPPLLHRGGSFEHEKRYSLWKSRISFCLCLGCIKTLEIHLIVFQYQTHILKLSDFQQICKTSLHRQMSPTWLHVHLKLQAYESVMDAVNYVLLGTKDHHHLALLVEKYFKMRCLEHMTTRLHINSRKN